MKPTVLMLLGNAYRPDPRVDSEARALARAGYGVTVLCWDRTGEGPRHEEREGVTVRRITGIRSKHRAGWRQLGYLPRFWNRAVRDAAAIAPDIVHCHDLDTLYAGWRIKRRLGARLVFDAHECYPENMALYLPAAFIPPLRWWESWLLRYVDVTVTASEGLSDYIRAKRQHSVFTVGNYVDAGIYRDVPTESVRAARAQTGVRPEKLLVAYIAGFSRNRMLLPFVDAAAMLPDVQFHVWGAGAQQDDVQERVQRYPNAVYHGWCDPEQLPALFRAVDVVYYGLRRDIPGARFNSPNTLSQAMAAGRPLIVTDGGELGRIVRAERCGLVINEATPQSIAEAITSIADPDTRSAMGGNGRRAAEQRYNQTSMQEQLVAIYDSHLCS